MNSIDSALADLPTTGGSTVAMLPDAGHRARLFREWAEPPLGTSGPHPPEDRPNAITGVVLDNSSQPIRAVYAEAFALMRAVYVLRGNDGMWDFLRSNDMAPLPQSAHARMPIPPAEEDRLLVTLQLRAAHRRIERLAQERVAMVQLQAAGCALQRLDGALLQVVAARSLVTVPDGVFDPEAPPADPNQVYTEWDPLPPAAKPADEFELDMARSSELLSGLSACQALLRSVSRAQSNLDATRRDASKRAINGQPWYMFISVAPRTAWTSPGVREVANQVDADPAVQQAVEDLAEARRRLASELVVAGQANPVLLRIYQDANPNDPGDVARRVVECLRSTRAVNRELHKAIEADNERVWGYPPTVRAAMAELGVVPDASITRVAAEERLGAGPAATVASQLALASGLATGGMAVVALSGGTTAPAVAAVILAADVITSLLSAYDQWREYNLLRAGYDAVLDPGNALGAEPGVWGTVLGVLFDLAGMVPGPSPKRVLR